MKIERAKQCLKSIDLFAYGDEKDEYEFEEVKQAINLSIKSFDMWETILNNLKDLEENMEDVDMTKFTIKFIIKMINEYMEEIEE